MPILTLLLALLPASARSDDDGVRIEGDAAKFLFTLALDTSDSRPERPDKVEFLGGCFFQLKQLQLQRLFCEFGEGRITRPDRLLSIVQPHLAFAPYPGVGDPAEGREGRALGIRYNCERKNSSAGPRFSCLLKDHFYKRREELIPVRSGAAPF